MAFSALSQLTTFVSNPKAPPNLKKFIDQHLKRAHSIGFYSTILTSIFTLCLHNFELDKWFVSRPLYNLHRMLPQQSPQLLSATLQTQRSNRSGTFSDNKEMALTEDEREAN